MKRRKDNQLQSPKVTYSIKYSRRICRGGNIQRVPHLPKPVVQNEKNGHKNSINSHNYHDENHDEIESYQGNSKRSTQWGRQLVSFRFENRLPVSEYRNYQKQTCISSEPGAKANRQWDRVGWMLADHRDGLLSWSLLEIRFQRLWLESCIQQRKTTYPLPTRK